MNQEGRTVIEKANIVPCLLVEGYVSKSEESLTLNMGWSSENLNTRSN